MAAPRTPRNTSAPGDYTAREKARLAKEHAKEIEASQIAKGIQTQAEIDAEANGTWDPSTNELVSDEVSDEIVYVEEDEPLDPAAPQDRPVDAFKDLRNTDVPQVEDSRDSNPFEIAPDPEPKNIVFVEDRKVKIRVNSDIEEMTFGAGTNYNFYIGKTYAVPRPLADHLESKGLVYH